MIENHNKFGYLALLWQKKRKKEMWYFDVKTITYNKKKCAKIVNSSWKNVHFQSYSPDAIFSSISAYSSSRENRHVNFGHRWTFQ